MVDPHQSHIKAGKIAARVLKEVKDEVKPGVTALRICTVAEKKIMDYGASPAFPCNVNINHIAAHHSSPRRDPTKIPDFGLVKIDIGVHIDGYIVDTATTIDIDGTLEGFVSATDDALAEAITMMEPGVKLGDVGQEIERIIKAYGLRTIKNLSGLASSGIVYMLGRLFLTLRNASQIQLNLEIAWQLNHMLLQAPVW